MIQASATHIIGVGAYLPPLKVTSEELMREIRSERFGVPTEFLSRASGIEERRFSTNEDTLSSLALKASIHALSNSNIDPLDIDMIIFCGIENDYPEPSTAHEIQRELGAKNAICFDLSNACLGLLSGISVADAYISQGALENVLLCTGEKPSKVTYDVIRQLLEVNRKEDFRRLMGALTVGDAGGAFIVSKSHGNIGIKKIRIETYTEHSKLCHYKQMERHIEFVMEMEAISNAMTEAHKKIIHETYSMLNITPSDITKIYCHQVGAKPHAKMAKLCGVPLQKAPETYKLHGNLTSATFSVNMHINPPESGENILFLGAGSGLSVIQMGMQF